jgi:hypothetical protein
MKKQLHIFVVMTILWGSQVVVASDFSHVFEEWKNSGREWQRIFDPQNPKNDWLGRVISTYNRLFFWLIF